MKNSVFFPPYMIWKSTKATHSKMPFLRGCSFVFSYLLMPAYMPLKAGVRFSMKAVAPSTKSSVCVTLAKDSTSA